jgi:hypothetical protein
MAGSQRLGRCKTATIPLVQNRIKRLKPQPNGAVVNHKQESSRADSPGESPKPKKCRAAIQLFINKPLLDAHRPWRYVKVTDQRTAKDFAKCMRELVDVHFPEADCIRVVLDNLSTHTAAALYQTFPPAEARRVSRRLEFHYTPKHASWLNMVEIEIGVLRTQCLDRRIDNREDMETEIVAWQHQRNASGARINWMFSTEKARTKLARAYPKLDGKES